MGKIEREGNLSTYGYYKGQLPFLAVDIMNCGLFHLYCEQVTCRDSHTGGIMWHQSHILYVAASMALRYPS